MLRPEAREFQGEIKWSEASFDGDVRWKYKFVFSSSFDRIESGRVQCYDKDEATTNVTRFRSKPRAQVHDGLVYTLNQSEQIRLLSSNIINE